MNDWMRRLFAFLILLLRVIRGEESVGERAMESESLDREVTGDSAEPAAAPGPTPAEAPLAELQRLIEDLKLQVDELRASDSDAEALEQRLRELDELAGRAAALIASEERR